MIAGGGPVGLFLACELRLAGVSVLVLEQAKDPISPLKALPFGMRGLSAPTLEALHRRGLLDDIEAAQQANDSSGAAKAAAHWMQQPRRPAGHFAGIPFFHEDIDTARWPYRLPSPAGVSLAVDALRAPSESRARPPGRRCWALRSGAASASGRSTRRTTASRSAPAMRPFRRAGLIGCDGGPEATVRKACGFAFVGTEPEFTGYSIEAELADADALNPGRTYTATGMYTHARPGVIAMADFDGGAFHRTDPITRQHVEAVLRRVSGTDVTVTALRLAATWTDRARQATAYRNGRVLLAGDAAHTHSPLGGQGLNLGLGDAMNLGWKLAATIRGHAPAGLLDSYFDERQPEGARILDGSRAQVALMRPTPSSRALEAIVRDLIATRDGATYFAERVWGVSLRYDLGGGHPFVGRSVPDFELGDCARVGDRLRAGRGLLLDFTGAPRLRALATRWSGRLDYVASQADNRLGIGAAIVRPDGFVA